MLITRRAEFSASHCCANPDWSEERNLSVYGEASRKHGHNFVLEVTLSGHPDPVTGMVFDLKALKDVLNEEVVEAMDHRFLNAEVKPFDTVIPTAENIAVEIWARLKPRFEGSGATLRQVRLYETEDCYVEYSGDLS